MLQGIKTRAEGGYEPSWTEPVEIALWINKGATPLCVVMIDSKLYAMFDYANSRRYCN